ncbi:MAG: hypothetical protein SGPRY_003522 [Prymnesium sp.]
MPQVVRCLTRYSTDQVTLFWDGGCPLCSKEINYYKRLDVTKQIDWVNIYSEPERLKPYGVTAAEAFRLIHAVDAHGKLQVGVPAFLIVWDKLPYWHVVSTLLRNVPLAMPIADAAYHAFARIRLRITRRTKTVNAIVNSK